MIGRIATMVAAYAAAIVASGALLVLGMAAALLIDNPRMGLHLGILSLMAAAATVIALLSSALPALLTLVYAERTGRRSVAFYAGAGVVNALVSFAIYCLAAIWRSGVPPRLLSGIGSSEGLVRLAGGLLLFAAT